MIQKVLKKLNFHEKMCEKCCNLFKFIVLTQTRYCKTILS